MYLVHLLNLRGSIYYYKLAIFTKNSEIFLIFKTRHFLLFVIFLYCLFQYVYLKKLVSLYTEKYMRISMHLIYLMLNLHKILMNRFQREINDSLFSLLLGDFLLASFGTMSMTTQILCVDLKE